MIVSVASVQPSPWNSPEAGLASSESREPPGAFHGNQRFEAGSDYRRLFRNAAEPRGFLQQIIVYVERRSHMHLYAL